jgi:YjjG family noncanonical pyrimidine nucleotidase
MKPVYTWLLFDADHTILDFDAAEAHALEAVCTELAGEFRSEWVEAYHRINKGLWALLEKGEISSAELRVKRFADFQAEIGIEGDSAVFSTRYLHHLQEGNYVIPGARELLESLAPDFRMAVITNGIRDTQKRRFEVTGLGPFFEHIIISEDAGVPKPHTGFFDYALSAWAIIAGRPCWSSATVFPAISKEPTTRASPAAGTIPMGKRPATSPLPTSSSANFPILRALSTGIRKSSWRTVRGRRAHGNPVA